MFCLLLLWFTAQNSKYLWLLFFSQECIKELWSHQVKTKIISHPHAIFKVLSSISVIHVDTFSFSFRISTEHKQTVISPWWKTKYSYWTLFIVNTGAEAFQMACRYVWIVDPIFHYEAIKYLRGRQKSVLRGWPSKLKLCPAFTVFIWLSPLARARI